MNALSGAMRAAWKSIEWGMAPPFVSVISTVCPCRTWMTGPGAPPSKPQACVLDAGRDLDGDVLQGQVHLHDIARRDGRELGRERDVRLCDLLRVRRSLAGEARLAGAAGRGGMVVRDGRRSVVTEGAVGGDHGGSKYEGRGGE